METDMVKRWIAALLFLTAFSIRELSAENDQAKSQEPPSKPAEQSEWVSETTHTVPINGTDIPYKAQAGAFILKDEKGHQSAKIFYTAFTKENANPINQRPVTFCFNGGPGSSSVWLNVGAFGPM